MKMILTRSGSVQDGGDGDITPDRPRAQQWPDRGGGHLEGLDGSSSCASARRTSRHKLVQRIVEAYDEHAQRSAPELRPAKRRA
jgi:hypothetical protein